MSPLRVHAGLCGPIRDLPLLHAADALVEKYAPGVPLRSKFNYVESEYREWETPRPIKWYICDGLQILLHEIGHHVMRHTNTDATWRQEVLEEVEAWLWAEKTARKESILFDYAVAEKWFLTYFSSVNRRQLVLINWKWKNGNGAGRIGEGHLKG